jgi:hypothetical protein
MIEAATIRGLLPQGSRPEIFIISGTRHSSNSFVRTRKRSLPIRSDTSPRSNKLNGKPAAPPMQESFKIAKDDAFGQLPEPNSHGSFRLSDEYVTMAVSDVETQLSKAGFRLSQILNQALRKQEVSNR